MVGCCFWNLDVCILNFHSHFLFTILFPLINKRRRGSLYPYENSHTRDHIHVLIEKERIKEKKKEKEERFILDERDSLQSFKFLFDVDPSDLECLPLFVGIHQFPPRSSV